jgi:hypothetical protein
MIPSSAIFDQSTLARLIEYDAVVQDYRAFFALLDWHPVLDFQRSPPLRGRPAHPETDISKPSWCASVKALHT